MLNQFGIFVAFATAIPSLLSIPCFYYAGLRYVEHKAREDAFIEAAESFKQNDIEQMSDLVFQRSVETVGGAQHLVSKHLQGKQGQPREDMNQDLVALANDLKKRER